MRLTFPNDEHPPVALGEGEVGIGASPHLEVSLPGSDLSAEHVRIRRNRLGCWLQVTPGAGPVHLNGRPVRELALLRAGDVLFLGHVQAVLTSDDAPVSGIPPAPPRSAVAGAQRAVLRGVGGAHFGRAFPFDRVLVLGRGKDVDVALEGVGAGRLLQIELHPDGAVLRVVSAEGVRVNGHQVGDCRLRNGDQVTLGACRFVLDLPGAEPSPDPGRAKREASALEPVAEGAGARPGAMGWLIAAAVLVAVLITALLLKGPGVLG